MFNPPHYQMVIAWWIVVVFCLAGLLLILAFIWDMALGRVARRFIETKEFFELLVQYAKKKNAKRVMGIDE